MCKYSDGIKVPRFYSNICRTFNVGGEKTTYREGEGGGGSFGVQTETKGTPG